METIEAGLSPETIPADPERSESAEPRHERLKRLAMELMSLGVSRHQTERILAQHRPEDIERQLGWIGYRAARKKASLLVTAIDQGYEAPANLPPYE